MDVNEELKFWENSKKKMGGGGVVGGLGRWERVGVRGGRVEGSGWM